MLEHRRRDRQQKIWATILQQLQQQFSGHGAGSLLIEGKSGLEKKRGFLAVAQQRNLGVSAVSLHELSLLPPNEALRRLRNTQKNCRADNNCLLLEDLEILQELSETAMYLKHGISDILRGTSIDELRLFPAYSCVYNHLDGEMSLAASQTCSTPASCFLVVGIVDSDVVSNAFLKDLRRLFIKSCYLPMPDLEDRKAIILSRLLSQNSRSDQTQIVGRLDCENFLEKVASCTEGYTTSDLDMICSAVLRSISGNQVATMETVFWDVYRENIPSFLRDTRELMFRGDLLGANALEEIVGDWDPSDTKERVWNYLVAPLRNMQNQPDSAVSLPSAILVEGAPGTGKTNFAIAIASWSVATRIFLISPATFMQPALGESERELQKLFDAFLSVSPSVLIVEQLETLCPASAVKGTITRLKAVFRTCMARLRTKRSISHSIVIATTANSSLIDESIITNCFEDIVVVPYPSLSARRRYLEYVSLRLRY